MIFKVIILLLVYIFMEGHSARILGVFPIPSISHQVVFRKITQELANRGHDVTVVTPDPAHLKGKSPPNFKEINVHDVSYNIWKTFFLDRYKVSELRIPSLSEARQGFLIFSHIVTSQLQTPEIQELISNKENKFDLILIESLVRPALVFSHIFKAPVILISSFGATLYNYDIMGAPSHPVLYPQIMSSRLYNLTLWEKLNMIYIHYLIQYAHHWNEAVETAMLKQVLGPDVPPMGTLYNNVDMLFINLHPIWTDNQPVPPGVIYMGGIHQLPEKELPKDLKLYLDSSKDGVIYVSFGTNILAGMIPQSQIQIIVKAISKLPYNVLWKWDGGDELSGKVKNIKTSKWFPQSDLLRHANIKLFITQAGLQSTDEAITAGVPLIAIPMLGDQWYNAEKYVKHGIGKQLDIHYLNEESLMNAIETVINNSSYKENVVKFRNLLRDEPESPLQRSVWWIEYVIRHGGAKHLRAPTWNITYYEYFVIDILLVIICIGLLSLAVIVTIVRYLSCYLNKFLLRKLLKKLKKTNKAQKLIIKYSFSGVGMNP